MTPTEKAKLTRAKNRESQRRKEIERRELHSKMKDACLRILDDPESTSAETIRAIEILHELEKGR